MRATCHSAPKQTCFRLLSLGFGLLLTTSCGHADKAADHDAATTTDAATPTVTVLKNVTLLDGTGAPARAGLAVVIQDSLIASIRPAADSARLPSGARVLDMQGKVLMPTLVSVHMHLGLLKGKQTHPANYTRANVVRQLRLYQQYGVGEVLSLGTDQDSVVAFRALSRRGQLPGARLFTAVHGLGVPNGAPPVASGANEVLRPRTPAEARRAVRQLKQAEPDMIKIWVDDMDGKLPKMKPAIYEAVLDEAHKQNLRVAAHVYYLADAKKLVAAGVSVLAHSIRDQEVDDELLRAMKARQVLYIPTLSLDEYKFSYADTPPWFNDPFFRKALEPGVLETLQSPAFKARSQASKARQGKAFRMALRNLKKIHDAGIVVAMGTDSGAEAIRVQGFSEHLELQAMVQAGLTPAQVLTCATQNGAMLLRTIATHGTLQAGKFADFIVLSANPLDDIRNTEKIQAVWQAGRPVAGPVL